MSKRIDKQVNKVKYLAKSHAPPDPRHCLLEALLLSFWLCTANMTMLDTCTFQQECNSTRIANQTKY